MKLTWRTNPKTPDGWPKRVALSMLAGLVVFALSLPVSFLLFLSRYQQTYPHDPQNLLGALTAAIAIGLALAAVTIPVFLAILTLFHSAHPKSSRAQTALGD